MMQFFPWTEPPLFESLWKKHRMALFYLAYKLLNDQQEAEDITTETFVKLWNAQPVFPNEASLIGWLRTTTRNACLNLLKRRQVHIQYQEGIEVRNDDIEEEWTREDIFSELMRTIHDEIARLPPRSREVFTLRYLRGWKDQQIAEHLGINHQSVRDHLSRALKALRISLAGKDTLLAALLVVVLSRD
jgi:RNA polymerase sigma-70 factor (family 1)